MSKRVFTVRKHTSGDIESIANVFSASLGLLGFLPKLYTEDEERSFITNVIAKECEITVAESDGAVVSFLARQGSEIRLLHTDPQFIGKGAGTSLLEDTKQSSGDVLELRCFQSNTLARKFYESHGFRPVAYTDGKTNEHKIPDVRYRWEKG